jgi:hypothetical protein
MDRDGELKLKETTSCTHDERLARRGASAGAASSQRQRRCYGFVDGCMDRDGELKLKETTSCTRACCVVALALAVVRPSAPRDYSVVDPLQTESTDSSHPQHCRQSQPTLLTRRQLMYDF